MQCNFLSFGTNFSSSFDFTIGYSTFVTIKSHNDEFLKVRNRNNTHFRKSILIATMTSCWKWKRFTFQIFIIFKGFTKINSFSMSLSFVFFFKCLHFFAEVFRFFINFLLFKLFLFQFNCFIIWFFVYFLFFNLL